MSRYAAKGGALEEISTDMERMFDSLLGRTVGTILRTGNADRFAPPLDIVESAEAFEIDVDLPGVQPEEVKVEMLEGKLVVSGRRVTAADQKEKNYHHVERLSGGFSRVISLPSEVDLEKIDASYDRGVLQIVLPKAVKRQPKKIEIRTAASGATGGNGQ
jgi:HSP20 family protein